MTPGTSYSPPPAFGRFRLLHQIGAGVLGPVFRTHDDQQQRLAAVKAFTLDITPERAIELAHHLQALADADLEHPHIAKPMLAGVEESVAYLAQTYVAGESLDAAIRQYGPAPAADAARLIGHVAQAIDAAARFGIVHGALHPRDILVTPGETYVTGLGVAMALEKIGQHAPVRRPYAAPERESGGEWGAPADVFALAVIAYEVLTGRRAVPGTDNPFAGLSDLQLPDAAATRDALEAAVDADPGRRPQKAEAFARLFAAALSDAGAAQAAGDRGSGRRKLKPRAPKLPGLDDPLIPQGPVPDTPRHDALVPLDPVVAMPGVPLPADDPAVVALETPAAMPGVPLPADDPAIVALESSAQVPTVAAPPSPVAQESAPPDGLETTAPEALALRVDHSPQLADETARAADVAPLGPPHSAPDAQDDSFSLSLLPPEPADAAPTRLRPTGAAAVLDRSPDTGPLSRDLPVPRAIDPTRGSESFGRPPRRSEPVHPTRHERSTIPVIVAAAVGLLLGLLGGYEIGARWGTSPVATPVATPIAAQPPSPAPPPTLQVSPAQLAAPIGPASAPPVASLPSSVAVVPVRDSDLTAAPASTAQPSGRASPAGPGDAARPKASASRPSPESVAAAKPAPPAAASAAADTRITIVTVPVGADVSVDGEPVGVAPHVVRQIPLGEHVVRVTLRGYLARQQKVTLTAARPAVRLALTLRKSEGAAATAAPKPDAPSPSAQSSIIFASRPPGARVVLDGKDVGITPFTLNRVAPGAHAVELRLAGFRRWTTTITVDASGKPRRVTASLERDTSR
ncbi:MAG: PEGA domain-containing protein [Acidobacteriota bacterium]